MVDKKNFNYKKIVAALGVFILYSLLFLFLLNNTSELTDSLEPLRVGDIVKKQVVAKKNIRFIDEQVTEAKRRRAADNCYSVYTRDNSKVESSIYFLRQDALYNERDKENYERIELILNEIYKRGYFDINELNHDKKDHIIFEGTKYPKDKLLTSSNIRNYILTDFKNRNDYNLSSHDNNFIFNNVPRYLNPNVVYNVFETLALEKSERDKVQPEIVDLAAGDLVLSPDEVVTKEKYEQLMKIRSLEAEYNLSTTLLCLGFSFFYILLVFYILQNYIFSSSPLRANSYYYVSIIAELIFIVGSLLEFWIFIKTNGMFLSACSLMCLPSLIVINSLDNKKAGYLMLILNSVLFVIIPFITWDYLLRCAIISAMLLEFFDNKNMKGTILKRWSVIIVSIMLVVIMTDLPTFTKLLFVLLDCLFEVLKVLLCYSIAVISRIIIQNALNLPTQPRLEKLANGQNNLIDKFKSICTGSFEHSEIVADIAENAANSIGANAMLTKVAARFHDVGKMEHPEYFVENQKTGISKHLVIKNKLSAAIIKSHVPLGVKLLKENNFPPEVIQIVSQHHGNDLIAYFYFEAKKEADGSEVEKSDYSYQSDIPSSKESGILMLSDISEAATRSQTKGMTEQDLKNFVHNLIQGKIQHGQLDNSTLTIGELRTIEESIISTLKAKFHKRIVYPHGDDDK